MNLSAHSIINSTENASIFSGEYFGVFDLDEYTEIIAFLKDDARLRL